jgi:hypothetical protein
MRLAGLIVVCVIVGGVVRLYMRNMKGSVAIYVIVSILIYIAFDAHRLRDYVAPWSTKVLDMILVPIVYEGPPWFLFAFLPMTLGGWVVWLARVRRQ